MWLLNEEIINQYLQKQGISEKSTCDHAVTLKVDLPCIINYKYVIIGNNNISQTDITY